MDDFQEQIRIAIFEYLKERNHNNVILAKQITTIQIRSLDGPPFKIIGKIVLKDGVTQCFKSHRWASYHNHESFGEGRFYGYINEAGELERYGACGNDVIDLLNRIACDPAREISAIGRESGLCCYCSAGLTQVQSKIAGCGKTCADKYGVWYPNAKETREYLPEHPAVLVGATDANKWN